MALSFFSSGRIWLKAMREASSMQTWTNSQPLPRLALAGALAGDAVADPLEAAELLDVDVDQFAGRLALVADHRLGRLQIPHPAQAQRAQDAADRGRARRLSPWRSACRSSAGGEARRSAPRPRAACRLRSRCGRDERSSRPAGPSVWNRPTHFFTVLTVHAEGRRHGLRRLAPFQHSPRHLGSTVRRRTGIPMQVHPVPRGPEASQLQLSRSGPDGQPIESSQLDDAFEDGVEQLCAARRGCGRNSLNIARLLSPRIRWFRSGAAGVVALLLAPADEQARCRCRQLSTRKPAASSFARVAPAEKGG